MKLRWTKKDVKRVQAHLDAIAVHNGGWQGIATALGLPNRSVAHNWYRRGRVPPANVNALLKIVPPELASLTGPALCPELAAGVPEGKTT